MISQPAATTALSAPGKVLLTGGYLVLDRNYTGTVFALDSRIHIIVQQLRRDHRPTASSSSGKRTSDLPAESAEDGAASEEKKDSIVVRSPQFVDAVWEYDIQPCENKGGIRVIQKNDG